MMINGVSNAAVGSISRQAIQYSARKDASRCQIDSIVDFALIAAGMSYVCLCKFMV